MQKTQDTMVGFKLKATDREELDFAVKLEGCTLSQFIRDAVLPVARDTIVKHAIKTPVGNA